MKVLCLLITSDKVSRGILRDMAYLCRDACGLLWVKLPHCHMALLPPTHTHTHTHPTRTEVEATKEPRAS